MQLPFDNYQFFGVCARYNTAIRPAQIVLALTAVLAVVLVLCPRRGSDRTIAIILGFLWLWMGIVYHLAFFRSINPAATVFGVLFVLEGVLLLAIGGWLGRLRFAWVPGTPRLLGASLVAYALVGYPILAYVLGYRYPATPTFGLPCPTTIFTLGLLTLTSPRRSWDVFVIPLVWSAVAASAAVQLGVWEDLGLVAAGGLVVALVQGPVRSAHPERSAA